MPSRFAIHSDKESITQRFDVSGDDIEIYEYYNLKPTNQTTGIVLQNGERKLVKLRWGFVGGKKFFKARAETVRETNPFTNAIKDRRNLIIINGFFEWDSDQTGSTPFYFTLKDKEMFALAGIYNSYEDDEDGRTRYSTAVITVEANETVGEVFHRMPAIIPIEKEQMWLDPETPMDEIESMLQPYDQSEMTKWEVNPLPARGDNGPDTIKKAMKSASLDDFF